MHQRGVRAGLAVFACAFLAIAQKFLCRMLWPFNPSSNPALPCSDAALCAGAAFIPLSSTSLTWPHGPMPHTVAFHPTPLTPSPLNLVLPSCCPPTGERRRKSVRGCIISSDLSVINLKVRTGGVGVGQTSVESVGGSACSSVNTRCGGCATCV